MGAQLGKGKGGVNSEINVTPLVDVMLVLLIIFMTTTPMMQQGVDVNLPESKGKGLPSGEQIVVTIKKDKKVYLKNKEIPVDDIQGRLEDIMSRQSNRDVYFKADEVVPFGLVARVMGEIKAAGVDKLGMVTEPLP